MALASKPKLGAISREQDRPARRRTPTIMSSSAPLARPLEDALFKRSLSQLTADRDCCADCGRTPLIGEWVHLYAARQHTHQLVCELCRTQRRAAPAATEIVRHSEHGLTVRAA